MESYNIAEAKAHLSELVERAAAGEEIEITKRGEPKVKLVAATKARQPIDLEALRALREKMEPSEISGVDIVREMRDSRY